VHRHLNVGEAERDAWLGCMQEALTKQNYTQEFQEYLLNQLRFPAQRIHEVTQMNR